MCPHPIHIHQTECSNFSANSAEINKNEAMLSPHDILHVLNSLAVVRYDDVRTDIIAGLLELMQVSVCVCLWVCVCFCVRVFRSVGRSVGRSVCLSVRVYLPVSVCDSYLAYQYSRLRSVCVCCSVSVCLCVFCFGVCANILVLCVSLTVSVVNLSVLERGWDVTLMCVCVSVVLNVRVSQILC